MNKQSKYIEAIINQMTNYTRLDFDKKLDIVADSDIDSALPALAVGVNILGEELLHKMQELTKANEELTKLNKEKEVLLQEVHHRVKNNLQIISGLLTMQVNRVNSEIAKDELQEIQSRIFSISLIHEGLYSTEHFMVDIANYCTKLCASIASLYGKSSHIKVIFNLESGILYNIQKATPLGLLINEIICNCYKHYINHQINEGLIWFNLRSNDETHILEIKNDIVHDEFDLPPDKKDSLGNKLIKSISKQLQAELEVTHGENYYSVKLILPKKPQG